MARKPGESSGAHTKPRGFPDFANLFAGVNLPLGDVGALLHDHQRNMDVFLAANRVAMEASQAYLKRQMEIVQESLAKLTEVMQTFASSDEPKAKMVTSLALMKEAREQTIANAEELGELIQKADREVVELLSTRFAEAIDELESMIAKTGHPAP